VELYVPGGGFGSFGTSRSGGVVLIVVMRVRYASRASFERATLDFNKITPKYSTQKNNGLAKYEISV
jgi:hypothetical protein